jgi:hypothetical protein
VNDDDEFEFTAPPNDWAGRLLMCWFDEYADTDWFGGGPEFDAKVASNFAAWREALRGQPVEAFLSDAETTLAAVILHSAEGLWNLASTPGWGRISACSSICPLSTAKT